MRIEIREQGVKSMIVITNTLYSCNVNDHYFPHQSKFSLAFKT